MSARIQVENASSCAEVPDPERFSDWAGACLDVGGPPRVVSIRIIDEAESAQLNGCYRGRDKATNVLSFPLPAQLEDGSQLLGDLAICADVVRREAVEQEKSLDAHWAHMTVHGTLHLLGYDHEQDDEADIMEQHEREVLAKLGFPDPYASTATLS